jgi:two-component system, cell cycle response regulator
MPLALSSKGDILLVDDQIDSLRLLSIMLSSQGYDVRRVASGSLALKAIEAAPPDLLLLDIRMPGMDGYEVCQRLKANPETAEIPIVFLSALTETLDKVKAFKLGGADYITKPFQFAEILARIENQLKLRSLQQQLWEKNEILEHEIQTRQQTEHSLRLKVQQEAALNRVIQVIHNKSLDLSAVFLTAVSEIGQLLDLDFATILRYEAPEAHWSTIAEYQPNPNAGGLLNLDIHDSGNPITAKLKQLQIVEIANSTSLGDRHNRLLAQKRPGAWLLVPLQVNQTIWGALHLGRRPASLDSNPQGADQGQDQGSDRSPWSLADRQSTCAIADQLAIAIQQSELYQHLQEANLELNRLATRDGLTQVANRRHFDRYLDLQWREAQREQSELALILCDVDFFKKYNDGYGHLAGDDCLKSVAQALEKSLKRPDDLVARYGGEEFAVILPRTDLQGAAFMAQTLRLAIHKLAIPHGNSLVGPIVTMSLGVASVVPQVGQSPQELIAQADQALYQAKEAGRDRLALNGLVAMSDVQAS